MAAMSPVMTKVSGFASSVPTRTVVSSVLGKQFSQPREFFVRDGTLDFPNLRLDCRTRKPTLAQGWAATREINRPFRRQMAQRTTEAHGEPAKSTNSGL